MKESNVVRSFLLGAAVALFAIPVVGAATPQVNDSAENVVSVSYADLNVSSEAGLASLYSRLRGASSAACGPQYSIRDAGSLRQLNENRACYDEVLSKLVAKFDSDKLDAIHAG